MEITKTYVPPTYEERKTVKPAKEKVITVEFKFHKIYCSFSFKFHISFSFKKSAKKINEIKSK